MAFAVAATIKSRLGHNMKSIVPAQQA